MTDSLNLKSTSNDSSFKKPNNPDYKNFWHATHCAFGYFLLEMSTNSVGNLQSQAFEVNGFD